jgi:hypothetical protein
LSATDQATEKTASPSRRGGRRGGGGSPSAVTSVQDFIVKAAEEAAAARGLLTPGGGREWQRKMSEASEEAVAEAQEQWTREMELAVGALYKLNAA